MYVTNGAFKLPNSIRTVTLYG